MSTIVLRNDGGEIKGKMKLSQEATYKLWRERNELQARVKELEAQRDALRVRANHSANCGDIGVCVCGLDKLIAKIDMEKKL